MISGRKLSLAIIFLIAVSVLIAIFFSPIQAIAWHCTHGNHIQVGSARITLPLLWWPRNKEDGGVDIAHAKIAQPSYESLDIRPFKPNEVMSHEEFQNFWNKILARYASGYPKTIKPAELRTRDFTLYCMKDKAEDTPIICWSPDISWKIGYAGLPRSGKEAESIIATLERSR